MSDSQTESSVNRSGTVAIVGRPNVGKSTLLNAALREKLAIVTSTPQTTRDRILGVVRHGSAQIALLDTPGLHRPRNRLGRHMNNVARDAAREADVLVFVTAIPKHARLPIEPAQRDVELLGQVDPACRAVLVINKIDTLKNKAGLLNLLDAFAKLRSFAAMVPISALRSQGIDLVLDEVAKLLPERGAAYEEDFLTDRPVRFFASEYIREQVILATREEVPHSVAVTIERFDEGRPVAHVDALIKVARKGQQGIIIGSGGERLKGIGTAARARIEALLGHQVHLALRVTTDKDWTESRHALDSLGYVSVPEQSEDVE